MVACDAPTRPQFPELIDEGLEPYKVRRLWLSAEEGEGDHVVDIGGTIDLKIEALAAHQSQIANMDDFDADGTLREWAREMAAGTEFEYAERFRTFDIEF